MKKIVFFIFVFLSLHSWSQNKEYFQDKDGFFFFIGIDVPNRTVNLVWDEINNKPVEKYVLERSLDGKIYTQVIVLDPQKRPRDIKKLSEKEQESVETLNTIVYSTETGKGRFVYNELIPEKLIRENYVLNQVVENDIQWGDKELLKSMLGSISKEKSIIFRIKVIYSDGNIQYSGLRSLSDYLSFIIKRSLSKTNSDDTKRPDPADETIWQAKGNNNNNNRNPDPLIVCPPVNTTSCSKAQGSASLINGTCCNYRQQQFLTDQHGGTPCSNGGTDGYCSPLILDCTPASSDPCCAGNGCTHYPSCSCKPWECCSYSQAAVTHVIQSTDTHPGLTLSSTSNLCGNTATAHATGGHSPYTYSWSPGAYTTASLSNIPGASYTVTVTDADGCSKTKIIAVVGTNPVPSAAFNYNNVCFGLTTVFTDQSSVPVGTSITRWKWDFGNGDTSSLQSPSYLYSIFGNYSVTLTITSNSGCTSTSTNLVKVYPLPIANFSAADICINQNTFNDLSTVATGAIAAWAWNFGDGSPLDNLQNPGHVYAISGTYPVNLIISTDHLCSDTISKNLVVHPLPVPQFSSVNVCDKNNMVFNNLSTITPTDTIQSYFWNFGDGSPLGTVQSISHLYSNAGTYTIQLLVVSHFGCSDSINKTFIVFSNPIAMCGSTKVCNGIATQFTDSSTTASGTVSSWSWNFGDNSLINSTQNPSYTYLNGGIYNTTLIVNNTVGCADTVTKAVKVYYNPVAGFSQNDVCLKDTMYFTNTSTIDPSTSISNYLWVFADGTPTNNFPGPAHYYNNAGIYNVTMVTNTIDGCSDAVTNSVHVYDPPVSAFTFSNTCLSDSAIFTNTSVNPTMGTISNWSWNFGDGSPINTTVWNPHHLYSSPGNYQVTLITHSSTLGCPDTINNSITVFPMPVANFSFINRCLNQSMNFIDSSVVSSGAVSSWAWNFGDATSISTNQNTNHLFANYGTYSVSLISTTDHGCKDSIRKNVVVHPLPVAQFNATNVCVGTATQFVDASTIPLTDTIQFWRWNFGDGSLLSTNQNNLHLYATIGAYNIQLHIISSFGCLDSIIKTGVVNPYPIVDFKGDDTVGCEPLCVNFQNHSSIASGTNVAWLWNFGDTTPFGNSENPKHCYSNDSLFSSVFFNVNLTVTSDSGCVSNLSKTNYITVFPNPNANFSVQPSTTSIINPLISVTDLSVGVNFWNWDFGDQITDSTHMPLPHKYADTGTYVITLVTSTLFHCLDTAYQNITIEPDFVFYLPNAFSPNDDGVNDTFVGKGIFIVEYSMEIFDRWGNLIFFSDTINKPWDGRVNNGTEIAQQDVYVYVVKITDIKRKKHNYKGIVTLVK